MSSFDLGKKFKPASKAWKSLAKTLRSKLESLNISLAVKKKTHHLVKSLKSIRHRRHRRNLHRSGHHVGYNQLKMKSAAIYVDELFGVHANKVALKRDTGSNPTSGTRANDPTIGLGKTIDDVAISRKVKENQTNAITLADAWKNIEISNSVSKLKLKGIDEKAEEFITKFREDMKLQKEKSILDFQEMLARSS